MPGSLGLFKEVTVTCGLMTEYFLCNASSGEFIVCAKVLENISTDLDGSGQLLCVASKCNQETQETQGVWDCCLVAWNTICRKLFS
jgi:hypothetical protein